MSRLARIAVLLLALLSSAAISDAATISGNASLTVGPAGVAAIDAQQSLPVTRLAVPAGTAVGKGEVVVEVDPQKLQRELNSKQAELNEVQKERRFRASNREVKRGGGTKLFDGPPNQMEANLEMREQDALRDLLEVQSKLSTAQIRAPEDGYVVQHLLTPGTKAKRRKPAFRFAKLSEVRVKIELGSEVETGFPPGSEVRVAALSEATRSFRARVDSQVTTSEGGAVFTLVPLELPFLALGESASVVVTPAS
jgi:multidrug resistance efflux pump